MITSAVCFLKLHTTATVVQIYLNLKSNKQDKNCNLQSIQIAARDSAEQLSAWQKQTKAALILAGVVDSVEFASICVFHGSAGLTSEIHSEMKLLHYT